MIESGHNIFENLAYPALVLGLLGAAAAVVGVTTTKRWLVALGQTIVGVHLFSFAMMAGSWLMGVGAIAVVAGGFLFGGAPIWRYVAWGLLSCPVGAIYIIMMGPFALYVMVKGP